jgi:oxalate decarboxylase
MGIIHSRTSNEMHKILGVSFLFLLLGVVVDVHGLSDPQVEAFLKREKSTLKPLTLARRKADGIKPRHLRPIVKRDSITPPDIGQMGNFNGADPQPQRGGTGGTFGSSTTNPEIDNQNIDNVAPPTTDNGD